MVPDGNLESSLRGKAHLELESLELFDPVEWSLPPYGREELCTHEQ
jgi:hypothetical protein